MTTDERLMIATLRLIGELGYQGATTRVIAAEAGVSEVTLFRRFGTKAGLASAALAYATTDFRESGADPTDDLIADLTRLGRAYHVFVNRWPGLVARLLAEATVESEIGAELTRLMAGNAAAAEAVIVHHQEAGRLMDAPPGDVVGAFLGPILLKATIGRQVTGSSVPGGETFVAEHAARFLDGYRR